MFTESGLYRVTLGEGELTLSTNDYPQYVVPVTVTDLAVEGSDPLRFEPVEPFEETAFIVTHVRSRKTGKEQASSWGRGLGDVLGWDAEKADFAALMDIKSSGKVAVARVVENTFEGSERPFTIDSLFDLDKGEPTRFKKASSSDVAKFTARFGKKAAPSPVSA